ncbi:hypothetical protein Taro_036313, partial [Colocasia esculenta]|nr:hypothetical protein [Colocasia esculenta]
SEQGEAPNPRPAEEQEDEEPTSLSHEEEGDDYCVATKKAPLPTSRSEESIATPILSRYQVVSPPSEHQEVTALVAITVYISSRRRGNESYVLRDQHLSCLTFELMFGNHRRKGNSGDRAAATNGQTVASSAGSQHVEDALLDITSNDASRLLYLSSVAVSTRKTIASVASGRQVLQSANYIVRICPGKAPQPMLMALDTSNDVTWLPCPACAGCPPSSTIFDSTKSSSTPIPCGDARYNQVPNPSCQGTNCSFNMTYDSSAFQAALSRDTLHIADDIFPAYTFGCLLKLGVAAGAAGAQMGTGVAARSTFSYCLPNFHSLNFSGSLRLGPARQPIRIKTTPLLTNPRRPTFYHVNMTSIWVDHREVAIPPSVLAFDPTTGVGTIFDSGTMFTGVVAREGGVLLGGGEHAEEEDVLHAIVQDLRRHAGGVRLRAQRVRHQKQRSLLLPPVCPSSRGDDGGNDGMEEPLLCTELIYRKPFLRDSSKATYDSELLLL